MNFKDFCALMISDDMSAPQKITAFKREAPEKYEEYHARYSNTHEYFTKHRKPGDFLTIDNYGKWEEEASVMTSIGVSKAESPDTMLSVKYSRLSDQKKTDIRYRAMLQGRQQENGKVLLEQSDFDWLESDDYADIVNNRIELAKQEQERASRTV